MDSIRRALELSRAERARPIGDAGSPPGPLRAPELASVTEHLRPDPVRPHSFDPDRQLLESNRILLPSSTSAAADAFRLLRTQVLQRMDERGWRALAIVSPDAGDGRTLAAVNLAIAIAADSRHSALLTDLDLKSPSIGRLFGLAPERGVDDLLRGMGSLGDCLYTPAPVDRLELLPARAPLGGSSEWLASEAARQLVATLRGRDTGQILVFDLPALLSADDALAFAPMIDCALMVVSEGVTRRADVERAMELLRETPVIGSVLNRAAGLPRTKL